MTALCTQVLLWNHAHGAPDALRADGLQPFKGAVLAMGLLAGSKGQQWAAAGSESGVLSWCSWTHDLHEET